MWCLCLCREVLRTVCLNFISESKRALAAGEWLVSVLAPHKIPPPSLSLADDILYDSVSLNIVVPKCHFFQVPRQWGANIHSESRTHMYCSTLPTLTQNMWKCSCPSSPSWGRIRMDGNAHNTRKWSRRNLQGQANEAFCYVTWKALATGHTAAAKQRELMWWWGQQSAAWWISRCN